MSDKKFWKTTILDSSVNDKHNFIAEDPPNFYDRDILTTFYWKNGASFVMRTENIVNAITLECDEAGNLV